MANQADEPIRVAIIEDKRAIRDGLAVLIGATHGYQCAGGYDSVEQGLRGLAHAPADVLLLDIHLPGINEGASPGYVPRLAVRIDGIAVDPKVIGCVRHIDAAILDGQHGA